MFHVPLLPRTLQAAERDLSHADVRVRVSAARDLRLPGEEGERRGRIEALGRALSDEAPEVRREALLSLADQKAEEALDRVLVLLSDSHLEVRSTAVLALGEIATPQHVEIAGRVRSLLQAGDPALRYQAWIAHVRLSPQDASKDLREAYQDRDPEIRSLSLRLLEEHVLAAGVGDWIAQIREHIERASRDPEPAVALLAELMGGELGFDVPTDRVVELVNGKMRAREPRDEQVAVELSGRLRLSRARSGLTRRAFGRFGVSLDPFRWQACAGLVALGDEKARLRLLRGLHRGKRPERTLAVYSVGQAQLVEFEPELRALVGRDDQVDPEILQEALQQLASAPR